MECPYCKIEMERGVIQSAREIFWSHNKNKIFFSSNEKRGDVTIAPTGWISAREAYLCNKCFKVIINL